MKFHNYQGCGACPIVGNCGDKSVPLRITFLRDQFADNWGRMTMVFKKGETVSGSGRVIDNTVYCATASNERLEYSDFIQLEDIEVTPISKNYRLGNAREFPV